MKELTEQQALDVLDCKMNSKSEVECKACPLYGIKEESGCHKLAHGAIAHFIRKQSLQMAALHVSLEEAEKKDPRCSYAVSIKVKNGIIYTKTLDDYDNLIGDISRSTIKEIAACIWKNRPDEVLIPFGGRFVGKQEFIEELLGGKNA